MKHLAAERILSFDEPLTMSALPDPGQSPTSLWTVISGVHDAPAVIEHDGNQHGVQLDLTPVGVRALFGVPAAALGPSVVSLEELMGAAAQELLELRRRRPHASEPARLRWLAERIEQAQAIAVAFPPPGSAAESGTSDPTRIVATGSVLKKCTNELPIGTNEPTTANRTNDLPPGTNEPRRLVQPLPEGSSGASGVPPRCLNRHQRRRLAALRRRAA